MTSATAMPTSHNAIFSRRLWRDRSWNGVTVLTVWWNALTKRGYRVGRTGEWAPACRWCRGRRVQQRATASAAGAALAGGDEVGFALAPAHRQRVQDDDVEREGGECPQRVLAVAEEPELREEVHADDEDREPAGPGRAVEERETREHEQHAPDDHHPAPPGEVDREEAGLGDDVVVVLEQGDHALEEVDEADDQHHESSEADPARH